MTGSDKYRLRVGDYRVIYRFDLARKEIYLVAIGNRRQTHSRPEDDRTDDGESHGHAPQQSGGVAAEKLWLRRGGDDGPRTAFHAVVGRTIRLVRRGDDVLPD